MTVLTSMNSTFQQMMSAIAGARASPIVGEFMSLFIAHGDLPHFSIQPSSHPSTFSSLSIVCSFVHSFIHSFTHSLTHSFTHSLVLSFARPSSHDWLVRSLVRSFTLLMCSFYSQICCLVAVLCRGARCIVLVAGDHNGAAVAHFQVQLDGIAAAVAELKLDIAASEQRLTARVSQGMTDITSRLFPVPAAAAAAAAPPQPRVPPAEPAPPVFDAATFEFERDLKLHAAMVLYFVGARCVTHTACLAFSVPKHMPAAPSCACELPSVVRAYVLEYV